MTNIQIPVCTALEVASDGTVAMSRFNRNAFDYVDHIESNAQYKALNYARQPTRDLNYTTQQRHSLTEIALQRQGADLMYDVPERPAHARKVEVFDHQTTRETMQAVNRISQEQRRARNDFQYDISYDAVSRAIPGTVAFNLQKGRD